MANKIENILKDIDKAIRIVQAKLEAETSLDGKLPYNRARTDLQKARALIRPHFYTTED